MLLVSLYVLFWPDPAGGGGGFPGADKVVHLLLFAALAGTARLRFGAGLAVLATLAGYAVVSEVVQGTLLSASRSGDVYDALADLTGVALGWVFAARLLSP